ncbi:hypothetical protein EYF80_030361 [Liparis tanakae]|uniref:Uncharacterized protein n=1 Tax=Liparis tanakae TaxID=230148 RepID=A0A4Z2H112_9TELE|nr:hypothetical protein EYF80_030361 [Liparis tanakae]
MSLQLTAVLSRDTAPSTEDMHPLPWVKVLVLDACVWLSDASLPPGLLGDESLSHMFRSLPANHITARKPCSDTLHRPREQEPSPWRFQKQTDELIQEQFW